MVGLGSPSAAYLPKSNPHHDELVRALQADEEAGDTLVQHLLLDAALLAGARRQGREKPGGQGGRLPGGAAHPRGQVGQGHGPLGPYTTLRWHGDIVEELPRGAVCLASSKKTKNQVAVLDGIHYMVQADGQAAIPSMVKSWLKHDAKWATQGTGIRKGELVNEAVEHEAYFRNTFLRIFGNFLALALSREG